MRILHFSTTDQEGGSARSAYRIHSQLRRNGHRSRMLVKYKSTDDPDVAPIAGNRAMVFADRVACGMQRRAGLQYQFMPSNIGLDRRAWCRAADVIQLYNTHGGYFSPRMLPRLGRIAPIVWRLSDMWPLTGHCAYAGTCGKWQEGCGRWWRRRYWFKGASAGCPDLATYPAVGLDLTAFLWWQKKRLYARTPLTIIAPSLWMKAQAECSPLLNRFAIHHIPNGVDTTIFYPMDGVRARRDLGLPNDAKTILFAAHVAAANERKGSDCLAAALCMVAHDVVLLVAGRDSEKWKTAVPQKVISLGFINDSAMRTAYAAADAVVVPSVSENLPNVILEAFACARPVVAFDAGGIRDVVINGLNGLLVRTRDTGQLARAIGEALSEDFSMAGTAALDSVRKHYSCAIEAARFEKVYDELRR